MDPRTGRIELITTDEDKADAERRHLVPIRPEDQARVAGMNRHDRRMWEARERATMRADAKRRARKAAK